MRYKSGVPLQVYVVVDQEYGDVPYVSIHMDDARSFAKTQEGPTKVATYVLKEKK